MNDELPAIALPRSRLGRLRFPWLYFVIFVVVAAPYAAYQGWISRESALNFGVPFGVILVYLLVFIGYRKWNDRIDARAFRLQQTGHYREAVDLIRERIRRKGPSNSLYNTLAVLHIVQKSWEEALEAIELAEALPGHLSALLGNKGLVLWNLGRIDEGRACLEEQARRSPNDLVAVCNLGFFYSNTGEDRLARDQLAKADQIHRNGGLDASAEESLRNLRNNVFTLDNDEPAKPTDERFR